jgi:tRNA (guanine37-N1)-methyltransferase
VKNIAIVTLFPEMFSALTDYGVTGRAVKQGLVNIVFINPRDFTQDRHHTVDDRPYGGGPGMVMKIEPLKAAIDDARSRLGVPAKVVYLSPQGRMLNQDAVKQMAAKDSGENLILIAGRYEGIDERLLNIEIDEEWSIGDYVLSGGELPAMVLMDSLIRMLPGALGHDESAEQDSFSDGLLDCPHYTRPETYDGQSVPAVLLSGNHADIETWRLQQSLGRTWQRRPDLLEGRELSAKEAELLEAFKASINDN